jgi:adenylate kinase family enzyme
MAKGRIHVTGASGSGVSTLARGLATALGLQAFDTDDFFWQPTDPACCQKRPVADRLALMEQVFLPRSDWVLAGSLSGWGDAIIPRFSSVIFLTAPVSVRLDRLRRRECQRHGVAIAAGGELEKAHQGFLDWAMRYDDPGFSGRSRMGHEAWLADLPCPVIRLDGAQDAGRVLADALGALDGVSAGA